MTVLLAAGQSLAIFVFLVVALGRLGRKQLAGLTPVGYLVVALLGSAVETGLYAGSNSLWAGLASAATVIAADHGLTRLMARWPRLRRWVVGRPLVLVNQGELIESQLRLARMTEDDLLAAVRQKGYETLDDVRLVVLAADGSVGVIPKESKH